MIKINIFISDSIIQVLFFQVFTFRHFGSVMSFFYFQFFFTDHHHPQEPSTNADGPIAGEGAKFLQTLHPLLIILSRSFQYDSLRGRKRRMYYYQCPLRLRQYRC